MNDPKGVPEHPFPGTQKQDETSGMGAVHAPGPLPLHSRMTLDASQPLAPSQSAGPVNDDLDPMARLTAIVSQATGPAASVQSQPQPLSHPEPLQFQPEPIPSTPLPFSVPEVVAENRSAVPQNSGTAREKKGFSLFGRKKAQTIVETAPLADEFPSGLTPAPAKKGFWSRRKNQARALPVERTARDKRWSRRRRRVWFEELLGWIFVPVIVIGIYYALIAATALMGTTPEAVISGVKMILGR